MKNNKKPTPVNIPIEKLHPFEGHPYKVLDDNEMNMLVESIQQHGILSPIIVRPIESGTNEYEIISGHRRLHAVEKAGISEVPALIYALDRNTAVIAVVDSNLHREHTLPSEKAFAYKMKMEALNQQGNRTDLTLSQVATKTDTAAEIGKQWGESRDQVFRYIRLTELIPQLLQMVDEKRIALTPAVELSYLTKEEQAALFETIESEQCTPSLSQAQQMKKLSGEGQLAMDTIFGILTAEKPNQKEQIKFKVDDLRKLFPKNYTTQQIEKTIMRLILDWQQKRERNKNDRDAR
ncbi:MAG TPA: chromosome partitioning protein ParB [Ruminococcaceae bacterium]|nr:chromosome partitioning protein ParB [Oscillospiraceae bacterium]